MAPKASKPLAAEAFAMEQKLVELRRAMDKERAKREALMAGTGGGGFWKSGTNNGLLRNNFRSKQASAGADAAGSARPAGTSSEPESRSTSFVDGPTIKAHRPPVAEPPPIVSGSRLSSAASASRKADILSVHQNYVGGMGVGTEGDDNLQNGQFDEGDSHKSFLEALNEWRRGNRGDDKADEAPKPSGAVIEVQTDTSNKTSRPPSAKMSYFDRLVMSNASHQAGLLAACGSEASTSGQQHGQAGTSRNPVSERQQQLHLAQHSTHTLDDTDDTLDRDSLSGMNPMELLDRLEELELRKERESQADDDSDTYVNSIIVTTQTGMMLTKGVRLPDEVLLPAQDTD